MKLTLEDIKGETQKLVTLRGFLEKKNIYFPKGDVIDSGDKPIFVIGRMNLLSSYEGLKSIGIKGNIFLGLPIGYFSMTGTIEENEKYGPTLVVTSYSPYVPQEKKDIQTYLVKSFKVTELQASKITTKLFKINEEDPLKELDKSVIDELQEKKPPLFRSTEKYESFLVDLKKHVRLRELRVALFPYGFTENQVSSVADKYGDMDPQSIINMVYRNPYLLKTVKGIGFLTCDKLYLGLGKDPYDSLRLAASLDTVIEKQCANKGDLYVWENVLYEESLKLLTLESVKYTYQKFLDVIKERDIDSPHYKEKKYLCNLKVFPVAKFNNRIIYLEQYFIWEKDTAEKIAGILNSEVRQIQLTEEDYYYDDERVLNDLQRQGVRSLFENKISIISGYGGTGKSTIIKTIITKCKKAGLSYLLLAPTGKAVDVLSKMSGEPSKCGTIHSKTMLSEEGMIPDVEIGEDVVIIDESSMMSLPLFYSFLLSFDRLFSDRETRLLLVGDENQLPPVGLGIPYKQLLTIKEIPVTRLESIYRQKEGSLILDNSKKVITYLDSPLLDRRNHKLELPERGVDWETYPTNGMSLENIRNMILSTVKNKGFNFDEDIILCASYKGECGITKINSEIQNYINERNENSFEFGGSKFFLGDRVLNLNNWYRETVKDLEKRGYSTYKYYAEKSIIPIDFLEDKKLYKELKQMLVFHKLEDELYELPFSFIVSYNRQTKLFYNLSSLSVIGYYDEDLNEILTIEDIRDEEIVKKIGYVGHYEHFGSVFNGNYGKVVGIKVKKEDKDNEEWLFLDKNGNTVSRTLTRKQHKYIYQEGEFTEDFEDNYSIIVEYNNCWIPYTLGDFSKITLFYASSVHKAQGSQFRNVYAVMLNANEFMIDRHWLYTLLSRAQEKIYYFSSPELTERIQSKNMLDKRESLFKVFIEKKLAYLQDEEKKNINYYEKPSYNNEEEDKEVREDDKDKDEEKTIIKEKVREKTEREKRNERGESNKTHKDFHTTLLNLLDIELEEEIEQITFRNYTLHLLDFCNSMNIDITENKDLDLVLGRIKEDIEEINNEKNKLSVRRVSYLVNKKNKKDLNKLEKDIEHLDVQIILLTKIKNSIEGIINKK